jgi:epoxide hydrolase-like predicted phosphatase
MTIIAVIFDLGGVLVRTDDRAPREQLAARLNMTYDELSALVYDSQTALQATLGEISSQGHWEAVRTALSLSEEDIRRIPGEFWGGDRLDHELVEYVRGLRPRFKTALLSNAWDDLRIALEQQWSIVNAFDEVIISAEVGLAKPDSRIFHLALERLGVQPEEAVFVDDFLHNVEGARAVGMQAIHFRSSEQARADLEALLDQHQDGG